MHQEPGESTVFTQTSCKQCLSLKNLNTFYIDTFIEVIILKGLRIVCFHPLRKIFFQRSFIKIFITKYFCLYYF